MQIEFNHRELKGVIKSLETAVGNTIKDPAINYIVLEVDREKSHHVLLKATNKDVVMCLGVEAKISKGRKRPIPIEGSRFIQLVKASEDTIRLDFDFDNLVVKFQCNRLISNIRMGYYEVLSFPLFDEAESIGNVPASGLYAGVNFCGRLVSAGSPQIIEHGEYGFCAGSQSMLGIYSAVDFEGLNFSIPVVAVKPLLTFVENKENLVVEMKATKDFVIVGHDVKNYVAFRRSVERFDDISHLAKYSEDAIREVFVSDCTRINNAVKRVVISLECNDERIQFEIGGEKGRLSEATVRAVGENSREAVAWFGAMRTKSSEDIKFAVRYTHLLTAMNLVDDSNIEIHVADKFIQVVERGEGYVARIFLATLAVAEPFALIENSGVSGEGQGYTEDSSQFEGFIESEDFSSENETEDLEVGYEYSKLH